MNTVLRSPRVWLRVAAAWLIVSGLTHLGWHVWTLVLENGMIGLREFAMGAMKQARSSEPLHPSLWRQMRAFSVSFGLLLLFAGAVDAFVSGSSIPRRAQRGYALLATVFWTLAFAPFAFVDPVIVPILISAVAVPLHAIAYAAACLPEEDSS